MAINKHFVKEHDTKNLDCILRWPSERARRWSEQLVDSIIADTNVDCLIGIGSAVRNVSTSADVDFLLIYNNTKPKQLAPPLDVDVRCYRRCEIEESLAKGHDLLGWAVQYGQTIFDRDGYWQQVVARWKDRIPLPSEETAKQRAERTDQILRDLIDSGDEDAIHEQLVTLLTHVARARLIESKVYPTSRPELPTQLREIGEFTLASQLQRALSGDIPIDEILEFTTVLGEH